MPSPTSAFAALTIALCFASGVHGGLTPGQYAGVVKKVADGFPSSGLTALGDAAKAEITKFTDCLTGKKIGATDHITDACGDVCWNDGSDGEGKKAMASLNAARAKLDLTVATAAEKAEFEQENVALALITICDTSFSTQSYAKTFDQCMGDATQASKKTCACYGDSGSERANFDSFNKDFYTPSGLVKQDAVLPSCNAFGTWSECADKAPGGAGLTGGGLTAADACKCNAVCKSDAGCWAVAKEVNGAAVVDKLPVACTSTGMAVSPSLLLAAAFAAVLAGRGVFQ